MTVGWEGLCPYRQRPEYHMGGKTDKPEYYSQKMGMKSSRIKRDLRKSASPGPCSGNPSNSNNANVVHLETSKNFCHKL